MMELTISTEENGTEMVMYLVGRATTDTANVFEDAVKNNLEGVEKLILDLRGLEAISSAGLRVIFTASKKLHGNILIVHANKVVEDTLKMTGILQIVQRSK